MAAATSHHTTVSTQPHRWNVRSSRLDKRMPNVRLVSVASDCSVNRKLGLVCASGSKSSVVDPVQLPSVCKDDYSPTKSSESSLILIRHGESMWNEKNLFTGCVDVPLTPTGVEEAIEAGKRICNIPIDVIFTSAMIRAQMTAMLGMMQHRRKKVPLFNILKKFDGETITQVVQPSIARMRYRVTRLPKYMILHMRRFTKNNFFVEKNPTLVIFPVKNLELKDYIPLPEPKENEKLGSKYDLVANIVHDGKPDQGSYRVSVQRKSEEAWYEMQDLHVTETLPQMVALSEAYMQVYEQHE